MTPIGDKMIPLGDIMAPIGTKNYQSGQRNINRDKETSIGTKNDHLPDLTKMVIK